MPDAYRVVDRIQDQSDFDQSWNPATSNGYVMVWSTGLSLWVPSVAYIAPGGSSGQLQYNNAGAFGGLASTAVATSGSLITVTAPAATDVPLTLTGHASQTANLVTLKKGSSTVGYFGDDGELFINAPAIPSGNNLLTLQYLSANRFYVDYGGNLTMNGRIVAQNSGAAASIFTNLQAGDNLYSNPNYNFGVTSPAAQTGSHIRLMRSSTTTVNRPISDVYAEWVDSTDATRTGRLRCVAYYTTTAQEFLRVDAASDQARVAIGGSVLSGKRVGIYAGVTTDVGLAIQLASGTPTADGFQMTLSDGTTVLTNVTADGYVYSRKSDATQYAGLRGSGSSPAYPGLHAYHDSGHGYFTLGYGVWEAYIGTTATWQLASTYMANNTIATRLGNDANVTAHSIYRRTSYANSAKGGGLKIYADNGPTGATDSDGGDIWVYGGTLRGTGVDGDVHLGYDGTNRTGKTKIYVPAYPAVSPTAFSANVNDYAPTAGRFQRWSTDGGNYTVTGLSLSQVDGQEITIINLGSGTITLSDEDASSTAANRFLCVSGASITLDPDERADLLYDATSARWRVF